MAGTLATLLANKADLVGGKLAAAQIPTGMGGPALPESTTIERDGYGNVTSIIKESKTISITYDNGEIVSFTDNEYLWEIVKTNEIVTGITVTKV